MSGHQLEYVDALLDGQLTGWRRWRVGRHLRACPLCAAEYRKQRHVRRLLRENPPETQMSDSPEFFWSKVKAEIERRGDKAVSVSLPQFGMADWLPQQRFALATAAVVLFAALVLLSVVQHRQPDERTAARAPETRLAAVREATTSLPDTVATVLPGETPDVAVIWVSGLPWTSDMTELQTLYAHPYDYLDI